MIEDACQAHGARYRGRARRIARGARLLQLLPHQEPRRVGRRRRRRDLRPRAGRPRARCCAPTASARATTTASWAPPPASTPCRPRSCDASCALLEAGTSERRRLGADAARRSRLTAGRRAGRRAMRSSWSTLPFAEADHVYHLFVVRCARATSCATTCRRAESPRRFTTPRRSTAPRHTPTSASPPAACRSARRQAERICSLPLFPGMSEAELERVVDAVDGIHERRQPLQRVDRI